MDGVKNKVSYIRGASGAMCKVREADLDEQIASNRERYDDAFARAAEQLALRRALSRPSLIPLDSSLLARAIRWLRWAFRLRGPKP